MKKIVITFGLISGAIASGMMLLTLPLMHAGIVNFDNGVYYGLDPMGARIWNLLREPSTIEELCDTLAAQYDVERATLESDIRAFVGELAEHGLVEMA